MLIPIAVVLALLWVLGIVVFHVTAGGLHLLLLIALIVVIVDIANRRSIP